MRRPAWIVTDIEGTTTSISFVHDVLFPYARERMASFLKAKSSDEEVQAIVGGLEQRLELSGSEEVASVLEQWMSEDRKETELKALQGILWRDGYLNGHFKGHVYDDVAPALERWERVGIALAVYSSGSVAAQKLLFAHCDGGDLDRYFSANFDTTIGHKRERTSYHLIVERLGVPSDEILFLSDIGAELDAAQSAGIEVLQLMRAGNERDPRFLAVESFDEIDRLWS